VPPDIKQQRVEELMLTQQQVAFAKAKSMIGKTIEVLIDRPSRPSGVPDSAGMSSATWIARSASQAPDIDSVVYLGSKTAQLHPGQVVKATVTDYQAYDLVARVPVPARRTLEVLCQ